MSKEHKSKENQDINNKTEQQQEIDNNNLSIENEQSIMADEQTDEQKYAELNDKYLRLYSDFENFRKRTNKERLDLIQSASESVIKDLLPVIDDYERALIDLDKQESVLPVETKEGLTLIYNKLINTLTQRGLKPIEAIGTKFDENLHEAVTQFPATDDKQKGMVIDEITKGYYLYDKVIRYSKVVVAI
ncbi:MAG: nucleotide exchange factor GrpE [Bacteroidales bacterium]|jgi:molecular chaperone GrpE|nr:nucleotide exchange factor GrpE [Bacteroidales bacterium]